MEAPSADTLRVAARLQLGVAQAAELVDWAAAERIAGRGDHYLARLADLGGVVDLDAAIAYFVRAMDEMRVGLPPVADCLRWYGRQLAEAIVLDAIDPFQACGLLSRIWLALDRPDDLAAWGYLDDGLEVDGQTPIAPEEALDLIKVQAVLLVGTPA
ncbi:MAG: hypothetical protein FJZ01_11230 [Candidatus Sericytochromatia bacterium]|nr:hypothetical protein [Candidatus Tanganyikabacteria bacterium]